MKSGSSTAVVAAESVTYMPRRCRRRPSAPWTIPCRPTSGGWRAGRSRESSGRPERSSRSPRAQHPRQNRRERERHERPATAMCRQQEVASRRARSRSPAPSARGTSAPTAIIKLTLMEIVMRNRSSPGPRRREARIAEPGDVEKRKQVDDEDGDEPDRSRRRHHQDMSHGRAGDEAGELRGARGGLSIRRPPRPGCRAFPC